MTFLPIVERELRVAARRRGTYFSRLIAAFLGLGLVAWVLLANHDDPPQALGGILFQTLAGLAFIYALIVGTQVTSDCLSEEKREGTLGLLFLTDLKGYDVVLGKLVATSVNAFYGLLTVVPMLAIPLLLGGVTNAEFWRVVLVCVNLLFFTLAIGIFSSAVCRHDHQAMGLAILLEFLFVLGPPITASLLEMRHRLGEWWFIYTPATGCFFAFDSNYFGKSDQFWLTTAITQIYGWTFILLACRIVPRSWQDATAAGPKKGLWRRFVFWTEGGEDGQLAVRRKLLPINPFLWRAGRSRFKIFQGWFFLAIIGALWGWTHYLFEDAWFDPARCVFFSFALHTLLKVWFTFEAGRHLSEDRRIGGMELLLSTPLREKDIVQGQRLALWRQFGGPILAVLTIDLLFLVTGLSHNADRDYWLGIYLITGAFFVFDLVALAWVGMWHGLSRQKSNRAAMLSLAKIMGLPSLLFIICVTLAEVVSRGGLTGGYAFVFWCVLGVVTNLFFMLGAKAKLADHFRDTVTQRFAGGRGKKVPGL